MVLKTCVEMAHGGIYDQIGGGFHRYAVDAVWLVPHFEKMLYDNAQLARLYLHVFQITKDEFYKQVAVDTLEYIKREMLDANGGFYSTQDADSEGVEGKFFVWTPKEIEEILGETDAQIFNFYYDVSEEGNFEEKNILNVNNSISETAEALKIPEEKLIEVLQNGKAKLFAEREKRIKPFRDEKTLTAWNGLMLATFSEASAILQSERLFGNCQKQCRFYFGKSAKRRLSFENLQRRQSKTECLSRRLREFYRRSDRTVSGFGRSEIFAGSAAACRFVDYGILGRRSGRILFYRK